MISPKPDPATPGPTPAVDPAVGIVPPAIGAESVPFFPSIPSAADATPAIDPPPPPAEPELQFETVRLRLPLLVGDLPARCGHLGRRVDTNLTGDEGLFWQRLLFSARHNHVTFEGPRGIEHVDSSADLLRCLVRSLMADSQD